MNSNTKRFIFIDQFRGFVGILMLMGHSSYYLNSIWKNLNPIDPLFPDTAQFILRYAGYLCAPGFLMMAGAMVWWSYEKRINKGISPAQAKWHLIQRGIFLVLVQVTWVNSSWSGFQHFRPAHLGIISTIGMSVLLLSILVNKHWKWRLITALVILLAHPLLLQIQYDKEVIWQRVLMQTFVDSGSFNKYPVLPWFSLALLGSVMATGWLIQWKSIKMKFSMSMLIGFSALILAVIIRLQRGYGNIFPFSEIGTYSFFADQKYPPSLFMNLWFFGMVVIGVGFFSVLSDKIPRVMNIFSIPGKVPLFFYGVHIAILGIVIKRFGILYHQGGVRESLIGLGVMLLIMLPLSIWFYKVKRRSSNYIISLI
jgi:uncharacterized membrane protein